MAKQVKSARGSAARPAAAAAKRPSKAAPAPKAKPAAPKRASQTNQSSEDSSMLEKFTLDAVKDIYYAEKQILKALPRMIKAATTQELKDTFQQHVDVTKEQVSRLEQVFELMGKRAQGKKCDAIEGLIKETESIIEETEKGTLTRDVALIMAGQKVEHYEIATYGGLVQVAKTLGKDDIAELFAATLEEEKEADDLLTQVAENNINIEAADEDESDEDKSDEDEEDDDEEDSDEDEK